MSDWIALKDDVSGRTYYANTRTRETSWNAPPGSNINLSETQQEYTRNGRDDMNSQHTTKGYDEYECQLFESSDNVIERKERLNSLSMIHFDAAWDSDGIDEGDNSWDNTDDDDDSSSDDELEIHDQITHDNEEKIQQQQQLNDNEDIIVEDTYNKYWNIGANEGYKYELSVYADKYFKDINVFRYTPYKKLKHGLKKMDLNLDKEAQQIWKNINSFMGLRKTGKCASGHIDKLLRFALKGSSDLKDEIFCQICKQLNGTPSVDALIKGWKLMAICCSIFPPSNQFVMYLCSYLFNKTKEAGVIGLYAIYSLKSLDRTMMNGQRKIQPLDMEIQRIEEREAISMKIYFPDNTFRNILITSQTTTDQIINALKLNHPQSFGLFEVEEIKKGWQKNIYLKRNNMERQQKIDDLKNMPFDRELNGNERIMDIYSSWNKSNKKKNKKIKLIFKCKIFNKEESETYCMNEWKIVFLSAVSNVINTMYPLEQQEIYHLAALQLQATHGIKNHDFYSSEIIHDIIHQYIPYNNDNNNDLSQIVENILNKHELYKHLEREDAYKRYISYLRKSSVSIYFGCLFFRCVRISRINKTDHNGNDIIDALLGISEDGIILMNPISLEIMERYKMEEILSYGFRDNAFLFAVGTLMTQRRYQFATMFGKQMNNLLRLHIDIRLKQSQCKGNTITSTPNTPYINNPKTKTTTNIQQQHLYTISDETTTAGPDANDLSDTMCSKLLDAKQRGIGNNNNNVSIHQYPTPEIQQEPDYKHWNCYQCGFRNDIKSINCKMCGIQQQMKRHKSDSSEGREANTNNNNNNNNNNNYDIGYDLVTLLNHSAVIPQYKEEKEEEFILANTALQESSDDDEDDDDDEDEGWVNIIDNEHEDEPSMDPQLLSEIMAIIDNTNPQNLSNLITHCTTNNNQNNDNESYSNSNNSDKSNNDNNKNNGNESNRNNNNNNNDYNNNNGNGGRRDKNRDNDDDKNKKHFNSNNNDDEEDKNDEDEDEEEEEEKDEEKKDELGLNKNAEEFYPNYGGYRRLKNITLTTIDEQQTFPSYLGCKSYIKPSNKSLLKLNGSFGYDPTPQHRARFNIEISREFTKKIPFKINEEFKSLYVFMDKSLSLQNGQSIFKNGNIKIINYDFHDKNNNESLYCILQKQQNENKKMKQWRMIQKLFTSKEIEQIYKIKPSFLPKSIRTNEYKSDLLNKQNMIKNKMMNSKQIQNIINSTPWHKITIFNRNHNRKRMILCLDKPEFIKNLRNFVNINNNDNNGNINLLPIMMFDNSNNNKSNHCKYKIEYLWIVRIDNNTDIGISFIYNQEINKLMVSGIHLDKVFILNQHQLVLTHSCHCLNGFISNITHLKIGNPDEDLNRIKDLTKKFKTVNKGLIDKNKDLAEAHQVIQQLRIENEKLKSMVESYNNSIHSVQSTPELHTNSIISSVPSPSPLNIPVMIQQPLFYQYQMVNGSVILIPNQSTNNM